MTSEELRHRIEKVTEPILIDIFNKVRNEFISHGIDSADGMVFSVISSIISTHLLNVVLTEETEDDSIKVYAEHKSRIEDAVENAFTAVMSELNPGTSPDFQCKISLLDDGIAPEKSH